MQDHPNLYKSIIVLLVWILAPAPLWIWAAFALFG